MILYYINSAQVATINYFTENLSKFNIKNERHEFVQSVKVLKNSDFTVLIIGTLRSGQ